MGGVGGRLVVQRVFGMGLWEPDACAKTIRIRCQTVLYSFLYFESR